MIFSEFMCNEILNFFPAHVSLTQLSTRAMQGAAAEKELRKGNTIPNELLVDIIVEAIR